MKLTPDGRMLPSAGEPLMFLTAAQAHPSGVAAGTPRQVSPINFI